MFNRRATRSETPPVNVLAISGGGSYGAFDVGVLHGWTDSGTRPVFDVVTGISTGALIATFAFLGPQYDEFMRDSYVNSRADDVYEMRWYLSIMNSDSIARSTPLMKRIDAAITPKVLEEIAKAHAKGRRLYVGTTNLDTRRFVVWDMGAIASAGTPEALELYRRIILASASVPAFFPPVLIDIDVDGQKHQELHVDGGTTSAVFVPMAMIKCDPKKPCPAGLERLRHLVRQALRRRRRGEAEIRHGDGRCYFCDGLLRGAQRYLSHFQHGAFVRHGFPLDRHSARVPAGNR